MRRVIAALIVILCLAGGEALALFTYPEAGIDYQTMRIVDPKPLAAKGMAQAEKGDAVKVELQKGGRVRFINLRTREEVTY